MSQFRYSVPSVATRDFTEVLAVGAASALYALPGLPPVNSRRYAIRSISIKSVQQLGMIFQFYAAAAAASATSVDPDANKFVSSVGFVSGQGVRYNNAGLYLYYVDGLDIPYYMEGSGNTVAAPTLNVVLQIQGATAKLAAAAGALQATFRVEPLTAQF
jgi:hypothetical protein